jgi:thiol-disulfide isomerase/thioredoxin
MSASTLHRSAPRPPRRGTPNRTPLIALGVAVVVVLVALIVAVLVGSDDQSDTSTSTEADQQSAASVPGALPSFEGGGDDPAVGMTLPTLSGTDDAGQPMSIAADGSPMMIVFVAHWCPHCQREVPVVQDWVDSGGLPDGVELVSVATANDPRRPNYPPDEWLARDGWTPPVLYDADDTAAMAAGLSAYPFFVAVDGDGTVVDRSSGELTGDQLDAIAQQLAETR